MKVNIVCSEGDGDWIYGRFVKEFKKHSKHDIQLNEKQSADVTHYLPYYEVGPTPARPSTAWMSHQEERHDLKKKFIEAARSVDCAISHSKKYAGVLRDSYHLQTVRSVIPGVDLDAFQMRDGVRKTNTSKMVVGYIGRQYTSSDRKNPKLLKRISEMSIVEFRTTGGKMKPQDIPKFYADLDLVISPATIEGGPMAVQEALAVGVPILCMEDVGVANEFDTGVIKANDDEDFIRQLKLIYSSKQHLEYWRKPGIMKKMRGQVKTQTWERFVAEHDKIWEMVADESWKTSRS